MAIVEDSKGHQSPNVYTSHEKRKSVMCLLHEGMYTQDKGVAFLLYECISLRRLSLQTFYLHFLWVFTSHYGPSRVIYALLKNGVHPTLASLQCNRYASAKERDSYINILGHQLAIIFDQQPLLASFGNSKRFDWVRSYASTIASQTIQFCIIGKGNKWHIPFPQI